MKHRKYLSEVREKDAKLDQLKNSENMMLHLDLHR